MCPERFQFLCLVDKPARLNVDEAGYFLGFTTKDILILCSFGVLKPLASPTVNCSKYFAWVELQKLRDDPKWLSRATITVRKYWKDKHARKTSQQGSGGEHLLDGKSQESIE